MTVNSMVSALWEYEREKDKVREPVVWACTIDHIKASKQPLAYHTYAAIMYNRLQKLITNFTEAVSGGEREL